MTCIKYVPVNEQGDRDRQFGYLYDERDGPAPGYMEASQSTAAPPGPEDYLFIHFRGAGCRGDSPQPGGTAEPASVRGQRRPRISGARRSSDRPQSTAEGLERGGRLSERSQRLETVSERFDEWESCVSWVPVTESGDPDRKFGYLFGAKGAPAGTGRRCTSTAADWDDPDYMFLALVGGDRPGRTCQDEPGEGID